MSDRSTEETKPDLSRNVARLTVELTGLRYWVRRMYCEGWRHNPRAGADLVRGHMAAARRTKPPLPDMDVEDQKAILEAMSIEIDQVGEEIIADMMELPRGVVPQVRPDGVLDVGALLQVIEHLARTAQAQERWIMEGFHLMSSGRPGRMADLIRAKMHAMKSDPPMGPAHLSPAELDAAMCAELPAVLATGENIAHLLTETQASIDRRRAEAAFKET